MGVKFGTEEGTFGPLLRAKFHPQRCNVSPLWGENPQNRLLSKLNNRHFALRAMLPVKKVHLRNHNVFFHVFAQTTHVVAAPRGFACVGIPATRLYIPSFIEIRSGVSEPQGVKIWPFPLLWLVAFTTACTTVQAVIGKPAKPDSRRNFLKPADNNRPASA